MAASFVDTARITVKAGNGGNDHAGQHVLPQPLPLIALPRGKQIPHPRRLTSASADASIHLI